MDDTVGHHPIEALVLECRECARCPGAAEGHIQVVAPCLRFKSRPSFDRVLEASLRPLEVTGRINLVQSGVGTLAHAGVASDAARN